MPPCAATGPHNNHASINGRRSVSCRLLPRSESLTNVLVEYQAPGRSALLLPLFDRAEVSGAVLHFSAAFCSCVVLSFVAHHCWQPQHLYFLFLFCCNTTVGQGGFYSKFSPHPLFLRVWHSSWQWLVNKFNQGTSPSMPMTD